MPKYKIYAGLDGSFGGANYHGTYEYDNEEDALNNAYLLAEEEYQSYEGLYGLLDWTNCRQDLIDSFGKIPTDEEVDDHYQEQINSWISYYVKPVE